MKEKVYDIIGVGIGPFNLGLASLLKPVEEQVSSLFLDQSSSFDWHPGLMLNSSTLQVPFMADLVTLTDPTSPYSFLNYLKKNNRIYKFYIRENFLILRKEYNEYCKWVVNQLNNCLFNHKVIDIKYEQNDKIYEVFVEGTNEGVKSYLTKKLIIGTGSKPNIPLGIKVNNKNIIHSSNYLNYKSIIKSKENVTVIGSGQSAAEIFQDLLPNSRSENFHLNWFTRPNRFFAMEYSKLTLELTSPEYVDYFHQFSSKESDSLLKKQKSLYKGINQDLINEIYDELYEISVDTEPNVTIQPNSNLQQLIENKEGLTLNFEHSENHKKFSYNTDFLIISTGYKYESPKFLNNIEHLINKDNEGKYAVSRDYTMDDNKSIFAQNIEISNHGFVTPDLGMGAYRNAKIINQLIKRDIYFVEKDIAFQKFDV